MNQPAHPSFIQIETTLACNAECPFCSHATLTRRPRRMADWVWKKIIDETRGLGITYRPFLINEPLADHRLADIMRYIRQDPTARVELNSNGELMKEERARELLDAGLDIIRFSIDGFSEETFSKSRVGLDYHLTVERVVRFIELARQAGSTAHIEVRMIAMDHNRHEQEAFVDFWEKAGAIAVITDLYLWPWEQGVKPVQLPCKKVLKEMFFFVNGKASLCCWDSHERGVVGDVTREHVLDIWTGELNRRYRALLEQGRRDELLLCSNCEAYKGHHFDGFPAPALAQA
ncbi:MAG TPA: radical SAM/SPASM domain-containing protein [Candidatus Krumholzibacteria bacterium]|nr:radical SAM/SPASM domain-containing protein [Candidatus Krumholzibacteria bacterium]